MTRKNRKTMMPGTRSVARSAKNIRWVEAVMDGGGHGVVEEESVVRVLLPGGAVVEMKSPEQVPMVARLLKALAGGEDMAC